MNEDQRKYLEYKVKRLLQRQVIETYRLNRETARLNFITSLKELWISHHNSKP